MKNFIRSRKAISPIFATLILIAIAVIAGVVVYMFVSGSLATMTSNTSNINDRISVQGASATASGASVIVTNTGSKSATVTGLILKDSSGNTVASTTSVTAASGSANPVLAGTTATLNSGTWSATLTTGAQYTITVITSGGGSFLSAPFVPVPTS